MINLCHVCVLHCGALTAPNQATPDEQRTSLPVDDAFAVEEEKADCYLCCIKPTGRDEKGGSSLLVSLSVRRMFAMFSANSEEDDDEEKNQGMEFERVMKGMVSKQMKGRKMKKDGGVGIHLR